MSFDIIGGSINRKEPPRIHYYDQDFVDVYDKSWIWIKDFWNKWSPDEVYSKPYFLQPDQTVIDQADSVYSSFFLAYSNNLYPPYHGLDFFYSRQEPNGAIRSQYRVDDGQPVFSHGNPEGLAPPLFAWAEYNLYHKIGLKRRLKDVLPFLQKHLAWIETVCKQENGLFKAPVSAGGMTNAPRTKAAYPVDFNSQIAISFLYLSAIGDILNDKETAFIYKRQYYSIKTRINSQMWSDETGFYHDLDENGTLLPIKTAAGFWPLLAELPTEARSEVLIAKLADEKMFATPNPFPSVSVDEPQFSKAGDGYNGGVFPVLTFVIVKGLEKYSKYELARESAIKHLYYILDTLHPDGKNKGNLWNAYLPFRDGPSRWEGPDSGLVQHHLASSCLATVALMVENIVGLLISLPRKTVDWIVPTLELMGIDNLSLRRNFISIISGKSGRGWEIRLESEKLYYFTVNVIGQKKKTLPIPSGKCSMLIEKI